MLLTSRLEEPFNSDLRVLCLTGLERCAWREGAWRPTAWRPRSLLVPDLMSCPLRRGIPERVAGAILSVTSGRRRTCWCIIYASESTGLHSGLPGHGLPASRPRQVQGTSQEPQPRPSGPDHPCAGPPAPKPGGGS